MENFSTDTKVTTDTQDTVDRLTLCISRKVIHVKRLRRESFLPQCFHGEQVFDIIPEKLLQISKTD